VALFTASNLLIPDLDETSEVDSRSFYYDNHRGFFAVMSVAVVWGIPIYPVMFGQLDPIFEWLLLFLAVMVTLMVTKYEAVHTLLTVVAWLLFATFVASYGFSTEVV